MQLRNYAAMQLRKRGVFQMFQKFGVFWERSKNLLEHPSNHVLSFLSNVLKQKAPLIIIK
jgi:hypothetical protein